MPKKASRRVKKLKSFMEWAEQFNDGEYSQFSGEISGYY